jgi:hypothetical protein
MKLYLKAPQRPAVADGPILLELSLTNDSASAVNAPVPNESQPFEYTILDDAGERTVSIASRAQREAAIPQLEPLAEFPPFEQSLEPNGVLSYNDDLTSVLPAPLAPARYVVEGAYRQPDGAVAQSERVSIEVKPALPVAIAQTLDPRPESLIIVDFHDAGDGSLLLRKRQSDHTLLGRFYDMLSFRPSFPVRQASIAVEADFNAPRHWRWVAWIDGSSMFAGVVRATDFVEPTEAIPLGMEEPVLLHHGYVLDDGSGKFVVAGLESGKRSIRLVTIPPGGGKPGVVEIQLTTVPSTAPCATLVWTAAGSPELILSWSLKSSSGHGIVQARIDALTGSERSGVQGVFKTNRDVVEVACSPVIRPGKNGRIQVLLAPGVAEDPHTLASFDVIDPSNRTARHLPAITALPGRAVDRWVLPSSAYPEAPILALSKGEFWLARKEEWRRIAMGDPWPDSVRLWAFDSTTYQCTWFDTVRGYQAVFLRLDR